MLQRFRERMRDKTRDNLTKALTSLGVRASMAERGRTEEAVRKGMFTRSLGIVDIDDGPIRWVNSIKQDGSQHSPPRWWTVFCVPDADRSGAPQDLRHVDNRQFVNVKTTREKSFPLFGKVTGVTWDGEDHGAGLLDTLSADPAVTRLARKVGSLQIEGYDKEFHGWTVQVDAALRPKRQDWDALLRIAAYLLDPPVESDAPTSDGEPL